MLDNLCLRLTSGNKNLLVPWFLLSCFAYYENDRPLLSDAAFDDLTKRLAASFQDIEHIHKSLIDQSDFKTGHYLQYPTRIKYAVEWLEKNQKDVDNLIELDYLSQTKKEPVKDTPGDLMKIFF